MWLRCGGAGEQKGARGGEWSVLEVGDGFYLNFGNIIRERNLVGIKIGVIHYHFTEYYFEEIRISYFGEMV